VKKLNLSFFLFLWLSPKIVLPVHAGVGDSINKTELIKSFQELIAIRSITGAEKPAGIYLLNKSKELGFVTKTFYDKDSFINFSASLYPLESKKKNIVFLCHFDVVPANDSAKWKYPPFAGTLANDTIWGRGALDMKGVGILELYALREYLAEAKVKELPYNFTILFVSDEEKGGDHGAKFITEKYLDVINPLLVLGEGGAGFRDVLPSKPDSLLFMISVAEKRSLWLKLTVKQHAAGHGAMGSHNSANAMLIRALDKIENHKPSIRFEKTTKKMFKRIGKLNGGFKGFILRNVNAFYLRPFRRKILEQQAGLLTEVTNSTTITSIYNPQAPPNVIPDEAAAYLDCRLVPKMKTEKFIRHLKRRILNSRINVEIVDESAKAKASATDSLFAAVCKGLTKTYPGALQVPILFPATTDNSFFRAKNINAYGVLPIIMTEDLIKTVHGVDECIPVSAVLRGANAYKNIITEIINCK